MRLVVSGTKTAQVEPEKWTSLSPWSYPLEVLVNFAEHRGLVGAPESNFKANVESRF